MHEAFETETSNPRPVHFPAAVFYVAVQLQTIAVQNADCIMIDCGYMYS